MKITFLGGVGEVTGSKYLLESGDKKILVDCGLFQGDDELRKRNWDEFPIDPKSIDAVLLTHAHIDHTGYIPALVKNGFRGKIYCSKPTLALCSLLLVDSGAIQEEEARKACEDEDVSDCFSKPLYTAADAKFSLKFFEPVDYYRTINFDDAFEFSFIRSGHIAGASFINISDGETKLTFSGDLGRPNCYVMQAPPYISQTDYLMLESTYGNRLHGDSDPIEEIGEVVNQTVAKNGKLIIPAFAVGRTQVILYCLYKLKEKKIIPDIPIFLDGRMAIKATDILRRFDAEHKLSIAMSKKVFSVATRIKTVKASKKLNGIKGPAIIVSASGMASGGRVLHHLKHYISDSRNTILFVGYQAEGTLGHSIVEGDKSVEIHGHKKDVNAMIRKIDSLSAHADYNEILEWLSHLQTAPKKIFLTHGDVQAALFLKDKIEQRFGWSVLVPKYLESFELN